MLRYSHLMNIYIKHNWILYKLEGESKMHKSNLLKKLVRILTSLSAHCKGHNYDRKLRGMEEDTLNRFRGTSNKRNQRSTIIKVETLQLKSWRL